MKRRDFLATAGAATLGSLAAPRLSLAQNDARVLRFVPQANLSSLDAVAGTQYVVRNAALMIWDTLYGIDSHIEPEAANGRGARGLAGLQGLDLQAALRPEMA